MYLTTYILLLVVILISVAGQLLLKMGMLKTRNFTISQLPALIKNPAVVAGFVCYGLSTVLYFKVLARLELSLAYPTISLGYVLVIVMSKLFFDEQIRPSRWAAVIIICLGVGLVGLGA